MITREFKVTYPFAWEPGMTGEEQAVRISRVIGQGFQVEFVNEWERDPEPGSEWVEKGRTPFWRAHVFEVLEGVVYYRARRDNTGGWISVDTTVHNFLESYEAAS